MFVAGWSEWPFIIIKLLTSFDGWWISIVMVILNRVRTYLEAQLLDAQQGNNVAHQMPYSAYGT